jgi:hypothetical protein
MEQDHGHSDKIVCGYRQDEELQETATKNNTLTTYEELKVKI